MNVKSRNKFEITGFVLHMMAMLFMLFDHMWATIIPGNDWLTCVGRIAFPIFAFMIVEGYFHTSDLRKYVGRLLIFALLSEIPFNLVVGGTPIYPFHQNVLWTFMIGIGCICILERAKKTSNIWVQITVGIVVITAAYVIGIFSMVDYHAAGIFTVLVFYYFRGREWYHFAGQFLGLYYINFEMLKGFSYILNVFDTTLYFPRQGFAMLALILIWLYNGERGKYNKTIQYFYYAFYPAHLLLLGLISYIL